MHIVQPSDLREESSISTGSVVDRSRPIVRPFDHRARFQAVRAHLVDVIAVGARIRLRPVAEREQILQVTGAQEATALRHQSHVVVVVPEIVLKQRESNKMFIREEIMKNE